MTVELRITSLSSKADLLPGRSRLLFQPTEPSHFQLAVAAVLKFHIASSSFLQSFAYSRMAKALKEVFEAKRALVSWCRFQHFFERLKHRGVMHPSKKVRNCYKLHMLTILLVWCFRACQHSSPSSLLDILHQR